jgi:hypothetical protein
MLHLMPAAGFLKPALAIAVVRSGGVGADGGDGAAVLPVEEDHACWRGCNHVGCCWYWLPLVRVLGVWVGTDY